MFSRLVLSMVLTFGCLVRRRFWGFRFYAELDTLGCNRQPNLAIVHRLWFSVFEWGHSQIQGRDIVLYAIVLSNFQFVLDGLL